MGMTQNNFTFVEYDSQFKWYFFFCELCPLTIPFLKSKIAQAYKTGHELNAYHKRRLELQG